MRNVILGPFFLAKKMRNVLKRMQDQLLGNDMQTPSLPPLKNGHICMKDAQCSEMIEKSIFRFLQFKFF